MDTWLLHSHLGEPLDAFTVEVEDVFVFEAPVEIDMIRTQRTISIAVQAKRRICEPVVEEAVWQQAGRNGGNQQTLEETLLLWDVDPADARAMSIKAIRVPSGVRDKIFSKVWPWLLILGRWSRQPLLHNYPPEAWLKEMSNQHAEPTKRTSGLLSASLLLDLMSSLRRSYYKLALQDEDESVEAVEMEASLALAWLRRLHGAVLPSQQGRKVLSTPMLVGSHLAASIIGGSHLKESGYAFMQMLLPGVFTEASIQAMLSKLPSPKRLSSTTVSIDAACVLMQRKLIAKYHNGVSRYLLADSSPQAGRDWFLCKEPVACLLSCLRFSPFNYPSD